MKIEVFVLLSPLHPLLLHPWLPALLNILCKTGHTPCAFPAPRQSPLQALPTSLDLAPGRSCACCCSSASSSSCLPGCLCRPTLIPLFAMFSLHICALCHAPTRPSNVANIDSGSLCVFGLLLFGFACRFYALKEMPAACSMSELI